MSNLPSLHPNSYNLSGARSILVDVNGRPLTVDDDTLDLVTLDQGHYTIHEGNHYFITDARTLADTASFTIFFETPDLPTEIHAKIVTSSTAELSIELYEAGDRIGSGSLIVPFNNNRNSLNKSILNIYGAITGGSTDGQLLVYAKVGSSGVTPAAGAVGGGSRSEEEIIFRRNTKYLFRYTSFSDDNNINNLASWYELTHST